MSEETALGLLVPTTADSPNGPLQIGENAKKADVLFQAGGVAGHFESHGAALTRASTSLGAFSTPIRDTLPKVKAGQIVEVNLNAFTSDSIANTGIAGGTVALFIGGVEVATSSLFALAGAELGAGKWVQFGSGETGFVLISALSTLTPSTTLGKIIRGPLRFVASAEATNVVVELQGKSTSGTITIEDVILAARAWG